MTSTLVQYGFIALGLSLFAQPVAAYPTKPVRVVSGNQPGGATDIVARAVASKLSEVMGQQFVVDNRPGAGGVIALELVGRAAPDGYTLHVCGIGDAIRPATRRSLPFDTLRDFTRVSLYGAVPNLLVVHPSVPARTLAEFVAHAMVWYGLCGPAKVPVAVITVLSAGVTKALAASDLRQRFAELGVEPRPVGGREFEEFFTKEVARWGKVAKDAGITPE